MKSKQRNERKAKTFLRNSGSEFPPLEMIEGGVMHSIQDAYRVIAITDRHINESMSLITRHRRNAVRQT
jgi:hypothetical protein